MPLPHDIDECVAISFAQRPTSQSSVGGQCRGEDEVGGSLTARPASRSRPPSAQRPVSAGILTLPRAKAETGVPLITACVAQTLMQELGNRGGGSNASAARVRKQQKMLKDASSASSSAATAAARSAATNADGSSVNVDRGVEQEARCQTAPAPSAGRPSSNCRPQPSLSGRTTRVADFIDKDPAHHEFASFFLTGVGIENAAHSPSSRPSVPRPTLYYRMHFPTRA